MSAAEVKRYIELNKIADLQGIVIMGGTEDKSRR